MLSKVALCFPGIPFEPHHYSNVTLEIAGISIMAGYGGSLFLEVPLTTRHNAIVHQWNIGAKHALPASPHTATPCADCISPLPDLPPIPPSV